MLIRQVSQPPPLALTGTERGRHTGTGPRTILPPPGRRQQSHSLLMAWTRSSPRPLGPGLFRRKRSPPRLRVVPNEAILRCPVGGPPVMANQLRQVAEFVTLPHVAIRVVPFSAGLHHGIATGPFVL